MSSSPQASRPLSRDIEDARTPTVPRVVGAAASAAPRSPNAALCARVVARAGVSLDVASAAVQALARGHLEDPHALVEDELLRVLTDTQLGAACEAGGGLLEHYLALRRYVHSLQAVPEPEPVADLRSPTSRPTSASRLGPRAAVEAKSIDGEPATVVAHTPEKSNARSGGAEAAQTIADDTPWRGVDEVTAELEKLVRTLAERDPVLSAEAAHASAIAAVAHATERMLAPPRVGLRSVNGRGTPAGDPAGPAAPAGPGPAGPGPANPAGPAVPVALLQGFVESQRRLLARVEDLELEREQLRSQLGSAADRGSERDRDLETSASSGSRGADGAAAHRGDLSYFV